MSKLNRCASTLHQSHLCTAPGPLRLAGKARRKLLAIASRG